MRLVVDELVLRGFPAEGRYRVADALQAELRSLSWDGVGEIDRLSPLTLRLQEGDGPERVGQALARALHRALMPGGEG